MLRRIRPLFAAVLMLTLLLSVGCSGRPADSDGQVHSGTATVELKNMKFQPAKLTVKKGTTVTFVNKDAMEHDVVQTEPKQLGKGQPGFDSQVISAGKSWTYTFDKPGVYPILCTQASHWAAGMVGTVTVVE